MSKKLLPPTSDFIPEDDPNYYFEVIMPKLMKDVYTTSVYMSVDNKYYFDDVYLGISIEITPNQWKIINESNPNTIEGRKKIKEFAEYYNEEHIVPASIYQRKRPIVNDLHNVLPIMTGVNSKRANIDIRDIPEDKSKNIESICLSQGKIYRFPGSVQRPGCARLSTPESFETRYGYKNPMFYGEFSTSTCLFGTCSFEPALTAYRGLIARTVLYFHNKYSEHPAVIKKLYQAFMPPERLQQMSDWDIKYPPTEYEMLRHKRIVEKTGIENIFTVNYEPRMQEMKERQKMKEEQENRKKQREQRIQKLQEDLQKQRDQKIQEKLKEQEMRVRVRGGQQQHEEHCCVL